jgi:glycosyltransferase involved in cell wall biosynthesis
MRKNIKNGVADTGLSNGMHILIATPLYPPDIAGAAPYVKELAKRLRERHTVTVLAYGHIPEVIEGVRIVTVLKREQLLVRLFKFTRALIHEAFTADLVYAENGPSVELPLFFFRLFSRKRVFLHLGDSVALDRARHSRLFGIPLHLARFVANTTLEGPSAISEPLPRPEVFPLESFPQAEMNAYEESWQRHVDALELKFKDI